MKSAPNRRLGPETSGMVSRRNALRTIGAASLGVSLIDAFGANSASAQGRCMTTFGVPACNTSAIPPVFDATGWNTVAFDQVTFQVADYPKEAAFYSALMGWTLRSDDGKQAVMDVGPIIDMSGKAIGVISINKRRSVLVDSRSTRFLRSIKHAP